VVGWAGEAHLNLGGWGAAAAGLINDLSPDRFIDILHTIS